MTKVMNEKSNTELRKHSDSEGGDKEIQATRIYDL